MVVFDAAVLTLLLWEESDPPLDPNTDKPVERARERMEFLVQVLHKQRTGIIIPTPVLSEVFVQSGQAGLQYVQTLQRAAVFRIEPFDTRAAIELAAMTREALDRGDKKSGVTAPWQKIKIDRQIVATAKVAGAKVIYTDDESLSTFATRTGMRAIGVHELPLPPEDSQMDLLAALEAEAGAIEGPTDAPDTENDLDDAGSEIGENNPEASDKEGP